MANHAALPFDDLEIVDDPVRPGGQAPGEQRLLVSKAPPEFPEGQGEFGFVEFPFPVIDQAAGVFALRQRFVIVD